jgi:hypothetical protein
MHFIAQRINPVVAAPPAYPFVGEGRVKAALKSSPELQLATCALMYHLQTGHEQSRRDTEVRNKAGFMSSDAWHGTRIGELLASGQDISEEDRAWTARCEKYSKQLTVQLRLLAMSADPKLAGYAGLFSIPVPRDLPRVEASGWGVLAPEVEDDEARELAEFRAWKAAQAAKATPAPIVTEPAPEAGGSEDISFEF